MVRNIPSSVSISGAQLAADKDDITTLVLSASQNKRAINPEYLSSPALTVAGTRQGHKTDYYLLKDLHKQLPKLKRVFIGTTTRHFESSPNPQNFWKYRAHLLYYNVNAFERTVYFKDKLLFLGNTDFYSEQIKNFYIRKERSKYNRFGFQLKGQKNRFAQYEYDEKAIMNSFDPTNYPPLNKHYLKNSSYWFHKLIDYCNKHNIQVILTKTPTFKNYRAIQDPAVVRRRDSIIGLVMQENEKVLLFDQEENTDYTADHFLNENHLSPKGAKLFTERLDTFLTESTSSQN